MVVTRKPYRSSKNYKPVCIKIPLEMLYYIDELVKSGLYVNRSDVIRYALHRLIEEHKRKEREIEAMPILGYR